VDGAHGRFGGRLRRHVIVVVSAPGVAATSVGIGIATFAAPLPFPSKCGRREPVHPPLGVVDAQPELKVIGPQLFQLVDELRCVVYRGHGDIVVVVVLVNTIVTAIVQPTMTAVPLSRGARVRYYHRWRS